MQRDMLLTQSKDIFAKFGLLAALNYQTREVENPREAFKVTSLSPVVSFTFSPFFFIPQEQDQVLLCLPLFHCVGDSYSPI